MPLDLWGEVLPGLCMVVALLPFIVNDSKSDWSTVLLAKAPIVEACVVLSNASPLVWLKPECVFLMNYLLTPVLLNGGGSDYWDWD